MMIAADLPSTEPAHGAASGSVYDVIMAEAARASIRRLLGLLTVALIAGGVALGVGPGVRPLAALAGTVMSIALWGLLRHAIARRPYRLLMWLQWVLVGVGSALAIFAGLAFFFRVLGRWNFGG